MRISYHEDTDSLYVHLGDRLTAESEEIAPDTVAHFDEEGELTGVEFYADARNKVDLSTVETFGFAFQRTMKTQRRVVASQPTRRAKYSQRVRANYGRTTTLQGVA